MFPGCPPGKVLGQGVNATESFVNNGPHFENIKSGVMIAGTTFCFSLKAQTITDALLIVLPKEVIVLIRVVSNISQARRFSGLHPWTALVLCPGSAHCRI